MIVIRIFKNELKIITLFTIVLMLFIPTTLVFAGVGNHGLPKYIWKRYPYHPPGTNITFPYDEGAHDADEYPVEWWYANFHLVGQSTGNKYGSFIAFYEFKTDIFDNFEIRFLSISDINENMTYTNVETGVLLAETDYLDLEFVYSDDYAQYDVKSFEFSYQDTNMPYNNYNIYEGNKGGLPLNGEQESYKVDDESMPFFNSDHWYTKTDQYNNLLPFQYSLNVGGNSKQDGQPIELSVDMDCLKQPLMVSGDGYVELGEEGWSFYYCQTKLNVTGTITVHGFEEEIVGEAWIDHQWGDFLIENPPPFGIIVTYEWFSLKLDDNREIVTGAIWDTITGEKINETLYDGLNLLNSDGSLEILEDYNITPTAFWNWTNGSTHRQFASQWNIIESSKSINLTVTPVYPNQVMYVTEDFPLIELFFSARAFWEGVCSISGTVANESVSGNAYVELTHSYDEDDDQHFPR